MLDKGSTVNNTFRLLSGETQEQIDESLSLNSSIKHVYKSNNAPQESDNYTTISAEESSNPIYAWFNNDTIYYYTPAEVIYLNSNSMGLFESLGVLQEIDMTNFNSKHLKLANSMFYNCSSITSITFGEDFNTSNVTSMSYLFNGTSELVTLDISMFNTSKVTDMNSMFEGTSKLKELYLGDNFNTSNVTNMAWMFTGSGLENLDLSSFDTSKVTKMNSMFGNMSSLVSLNLGDNFYTSNIADMSGMFTYTESLTNINFGSKWDTSNVTNMKNMFSHSNSLTSLDLSSWNTSKVTNMSYMFNECKALTSINISNWNTTNVTNMSYMFDESEALTNIDISGWNTAKVTNMSYMFYSATNLQTIYVGTGWSTAAVTSGNRMFYGDTQLKGGAGTTYNRSYTSYTRAKVDGGTSNPGYLTLKTN